MDGILDKHMVNKLVPVDEDTLRRELRVRDYHLDCSNPQLGVVCNHCGYTSQKRESWKKLTATKPKTRMVYFSFVYCRKCGLVGKVHQ
jgi:hypothetical protein